MSIYDIFDMNKDRLTSLSYLLTQLEWHTLGFFTTFDRDFKLKCLYLSYISVINYYLDLKRDVPRLDEDWNEYFKLSRQYLYCNNCYLDESVPMNKLAKITFNLGKLIKLDKIQLLYKKWYKKKVNSIIIIQRNWRICRYNPQYKMCQYILTNQLNNIQKNYLKI
tara:strand:+ start:64 stop:558 length:495 start_codon:yes stop_codon:yes gene_type:complete